MKLLRVGTLLAACAWLTGVAWAASEGAEETRPALLTFDPGVAIWTIIVFIALMIILRTAAWKPLLGALKERETFIQVSIDDAKRQRTEAEQVLADYRAQLAKARDEATAIIDEGRRDAEAVRRRIHDEARQEADAQLARARREIELARDTAVKQLFDQTAELSVQVAARVLSKELSADDQRRLVSDSLKELAAVDKTKLN